MGKINKWVYDSMQRYYLWSAGMTSRPDYSLATYPFFQLLLSRSDRFSGISNQVDVGPAKTTFGVYNFHYSIIAPVQGEIAGIVTYVIKGSSAWNAGLRRGGCFIKVNGNAVTAAGVPAIQASLVEGQTVTLTMAEYTNGNWLETKTITVGKVKAAENTVVQTRYFSSGSIKTGYLLYNGFTEEYDVSLLEAFTKLKNAGVSECIVDLRYNAGGSVATCAKLAAMLAPLQENSLFGIFEGNSQEGVQSYSMGRILKTSANTYGNTIAALSTVRLPLRRVYILTTRATISASELLINNLKPYISVIQIGDTTLGKDEASIQILDYRTPREVQWILQPIVYKLKNALGNGGYHEGLVPAYVENELSVLPLPELGTKNDILISRALSLIYGPGNVEMQPLRMQKTAVDVWFRSSDAAAELMPVVILPRPY